MFDQHSSDYYNPVFLKCMRMGMRTMVLPGICLILAAVQVIFWIGMGGDGFFSDFTMKEKFGFYLIVCMLLCMISGLSSCSHELRLEKRSEGLDVSRGTRLSAFRIMKGYALANLVHVALPALISLPLDFLMVGKELSPNAFISVGVMVLFCWAYSMAGTAMLHLGVSGKQGPLPALCYGPYFLVFLYALPLFMMQFLNSFELVHLALKGVAAVLVCVCIWLVACAFDYGSHLSPTQDRSKAGRMTLLATCVIIIPMAFLAENLTMETFASVLPDMCTMWGMGVFLLMTVFAIFEPFTMTRREILEMKPGIIGKTLAFLASGNAFSSCLIALILIVALCGICTATEDLVGMHGIATIGSVYMYASLIVFCRAVFKWTSAKACTIILVSFIVLSLTGLRFIFFMRFLDFISWENCYGFIGGYLAISVLLLVVAWMKTRKKQALA